MPKLIVDLDNVADVRGALDLLDLFEAALKTPAEPTGEHPLPPDLAQQTPSTSPTTPKRRGRPPASGAESSNSTPEPSKADFVVFDTTGEKIAGYAHSDDAATILIAKAKELTSSADLSAFGKANLATMARLAKEDGARVQVEIGAHITAVKKAEAEVAPWAFGAFGATLEEAPQKPPMDRATFVKEMTQLGGLLGAQEGKALLTELGFKEVSEIQDTNYDRVVAACRARVELLKSKTA